MTELIKEYKDGLKKSEYYEEPTSIPFAELFSDNSIKSFKVIKSSQDDSMQKEELVTRKKTSALISSVKKKDLLEQHKKTQAEMLTLRQMKKEYLSKRNVSLPDRYMVMLSGLTTKAQEVFWVIYDSVDKIDCNAIADKCRSKVVTINCAIKELKDSGLVIRVGSRKTGHYEIMEDIRCDTHV